MDFGLSQADMESIQGGLDPSGTTGGVAPSQQDQDNYAQATANILAEPIAGRSRSNIRNDPNYDPTFAAALDISRGLDPTFNFGGTGGLAVPSYLRPQIQGTAVNPETGQMVMYGSPFERFLQEDFAEIMQKGPGITGLIGRGLDLITSSFRDAKDTLGKMGDAVGGLSLSDLGIFSSATGQKAMDDMADNVDMNNRTFDMFGDRLDTRQIDSFPQEGAQIPNFMTNPIRRIPTVNRGFPQVRTQ